MGIFTSGRFIKKFSSKKKSQKLWHRRSWFLKLLLILKQNPVWTTKLFEPQVGIQCLQDTKAAILHNDETELTGG